MPRRQGKCSMTPERRFIPQPAFSAPDRRIGVGNRHFRSSVKNSCDKPVKITSHALVPSYASAVGQRSFPRPIRKASTSLLLPGNRPEKRLGFGSTADFLKAATLW